MESARRILVVGAHGSGKSSLIAELTKMKATRKVNKLGESTYESTTCSRFMGKMHKLQLLETEDEGIHYIYKASVIIVTFNSKSLKSQQESTKIYKNIKNHSERNGTKIPIIAVFTKCSEETIVEDKYCGDEFHMMPTNTESKMGLDTLKLNLYKFAFPALSGVILMQKLRNSVHKVTSTAMKSLNKIKEAKSEEAIDFASQQGSSMKERRMMYRCGSSPSFDDEEIDHEMRRSSL